MKLIAAEVLARNVKSLKKKKGLTSRQLAKLAGVRPSVITAIESGTTNPTLKSIESFAAALGVSVSELLENK